MKKHEIKKIKVGDSVWLNLPHPTRYVVVNINRGWRNQLFFDLKDSKGHICSINPTSPNITMSEMASRERYIHHLHIQRRSWNAQMKLAMKKIAQIDRAIEKTKCQIQKLQDE